MQAHSAGSIVSDPFILLAAAEADDAKNVTSKIMEVTVYADRERVTRVATVELPVGTGRVAFRKLPG